MHIRIGKEGQAPVCEHALKTVPVEIGISSAHRFPRFPLHTPCVHGSNGGITAPSLSAILCYAQEPKLAQHSGSCHGLTGASSAQQPEICNAPWERSSALCFCVLVCATLRTDICDPTMQHQHQQLRLRSMFQLAWATFAGM